MSWFRPKQCCYKVQWTLYNSNLYNSNLPLTRPISSAPRANHPSIWLSITRNSPYLERFPISRWYSSYREFTVIQCHLLNGIPQGESVMALLNIFQSVKTGIGWKNALLRHISIWHSAWLDKLGASMNFRRFLGVICAKNLHESRIYRGNPWIIAVAHLCHLGRIYKNSPTKSIKN